MEAETYGIDSPGCPSLISLDAASNTSNRRPVMYTVAPFVTNPAAIAVVQCMLLPILSSFDVYSMLGGILSSDTPTNDDDDMRETPE